MSHSISLGKQRYQFTFVVKEKIPTSALSFPLLFMHKYLLLWSPRMLTIPFDASFIISTIPENQENDIIIFIIIIITWLICTWTYISVTCWYTTYINMQPEAVIHHPAVFLKLNMNDMQMHHAIFKFGVYYRVKIYTYYYTVSDCILLILIAELKVAQKV